MYTASKGDFSLAPGELTFTASDTNQECLVVMATSDDIFEDDETFTVTLYTRTLSLVGSPYLEGAPLL